PLQAWLPDAMEGPTPVSALIHAATMVTAGVYLIARSNPIYNQTPDGRLVVVIIGTITLLIGCVIGCAYDDIKKVLAYSTVSQIGYMVLAVGLGPVGYALGIMHLLAHGFFKAGLFLGAGSVMHAMRDEVDMRKFGGLWRIMPITWVTFGLGYLALIGFPFLSGFYTKDAIIEAAFGQEGWRGWVFGGAAALGALLTAFYMTRLMFMTFHGKKRWENLKAADGSDFHPHESKPVMTIPMMILALGSVGAGVLFVNIGFTDWLAPSVGPLVEVEHLPIPKELIGWGTVGL
ncbi:proton-conducting transporter membrane subunit, partial [Kibdelosporangium lantanae]